jgi:hypothetical protein
MKLAAAALLLAGCASIADIDTSKAEPRCASQCSQDYTACVSIPAAVIPGLIRSSQCKDGMRACVNSCPPR